MGAMRIEYSELRTPRSAAPVIAAGPAATPPLASTPITANCDPPENMNRLSTWVCQMSRPDATASAPNDSPYADTANPTARLARTAAERSGSAARPALLLATVGRGFAQGLEQCLGIDVLVEHGVCTCEGSRRHVLVEIERRHQHDLRHPAERAHLGVAADPLGRHQAVDPGHLDVRERRVERLPPGEREGLRTVARLAHHLESGLRAEQHRP